MVSHDFTRLLSRRFEFGAVGSAVMAGVWPVIPLDLEALAALLRRPGVVGNDGDPAQWLETRRNGRRANFDDALDTGNRQRVLGVKGFDLAAVDWAALDRGILHAREGQIDAIGRASADDVLKGDDRVR